MKSYLYRIALYKLAASVIWAALTIPGSPAVLTANAQQSLTNGLYLLSLPADYNAFGNYIKSFKKSGANTLVIRPVSSRGRVDKQALVKAVFFAHQYGMKIFVILPTRGMSVLLDKHPDWEDMHYDLRSGTFQPTGKLDVLNPKVVVYLSDFFRDVAGYSVDGIILDEDFYYGDTEGMSARSMERYKLKYGSAFSARTALARIKGDSPENHLPEEYGDGFWNLAELKKNGLLLLLKNLIQSSRAVNKEVKFGIPLFVSGLFLMNNEMLAWYSHDVSAFKNTDFNFFWLTIPVPDSNVEQDINYKKSVEAVSRIVLSSTSLVKDPMKVIVALQTISSSGALLPLKEIEEVSTRVRKTGGVGVAFMVQPDTELPSVLIKN